MERRTRLLVLGLATAAIGIQGCATGPGGSGALRMNRADLVSGGAARLNASELRNALADAVISGPTHGSADNIYIDWRFNTDGTMTGTATRTHAQAGTYPQSGKWRVNDTHQLCYEVRAEGGSAVSTSPAMNPSGCEDWFRLGSAYYAVLGSQGIQRTLAKR